MSDILKDAPRPNGHDRAAGPGPIDRAAINRANAQKSTGPRTEAGKQRSKLNALRHGLTGQTVVLPTEDHSAYDRHAQSFLDEYQPKGATETQLVQSLIDTSWRLNRVSAVETNLFSLGITENENRVQASHPEAGAALAMALTFREHTGAFAQIGVYCQRIARQFEQTLALLRQLQAERRKSEDHDLDLAADILELHRENKQLPYNPAVDGFVFSQGDLQAFIDRRARVSEARSAALDRYEASA